jgi:hypothetical protein
MPHWKSIHIERFRRLVLQAWDRMETDGSFTALDLSPALDYHSPFAIRSI